MNYFITSRIDELTSAIELAEIKRLKLFKALNIPAKIVALDYSRYQLYVWKNLNISSDIINPIAYFQNLNSKTSVPTQKLLDNLLSDKRLNIQNNQGFINHKLRIQIIEYHGKIDYVTYLDRWGFTDRRDFYVNNQLSYSEYFDDGGKLINRSYYNFQGNAFLIYHYRGGAGNIPVLTLIQLQQLNRWYQFDQGAQTCLLWLLQSGQYVHTRLPADCLDYLPQ